MLLWVAGLFASSLAGAQSTSIVGIVEGSATLIRQTTRYTLAEGVALNDQDIIETAPGAFFQVELPGGVLVGMGESTRVMFRPRVAKGLTAIPLYLLQGWLKTSSSGSFGFTSPAFAFIANDFSARVGMRWRPWSPCERQRRYSSEWKFATPDELRSTGLVC